MLFLVYLSHQNANLFSHFVYVCYELRSLHSESNKPRKSKVFIELNDGWPDNVEKNEFPAINQVLTDER